MITNYIKIFSKDNTYLSNTLYFSLNVLLSGNKASLLDWVISDEIRGSFDATSIELWSLSNSLNPKFTPVLNCFFSIDAICPFFYINITSTYIKCSNSCKSSSKQPNTNETRIRCEIIHCINIQIIIYKICSASIFFSVSKLLSTLK